MRFAFVTAVLILVSGSRLFAGPAVGFILQPATASTGVPFELTVRAIDSTGNTATGYAGTIHFTSTDAGAVLPGDYTFVPADLGEHAFTVTLHGDHTIQTVTVTDTVDASIDGFVGVLVKDPDHVVYLSVTIDRYVTREAVTPFVVQAVNRDSQPVASYRGTVHFTGDPSIELPADYTFTEADAGTHTFNVIFHRGYEKRFDVADGDAASGSGTVYVLCPDLTLTATNNGPVCFGSPATLSAFTNATSPTFLWQKIPGTGPEDNQTGQTVIVTLLGRWQVGMTDADTGCYLSTETYVDTERGPVIDAPAEVYEGQTLMATIANDPDGPYADIEWLVEFGTIVSGQGTSTITIQPNAEATDVITHVAVTRVATSCRLQSTDYTRIVPAPLSAQITTAFEVCPNDTGTASVPDSGTGATYAWSITNGTIVSGQGTPSIVFGAPQAGVVHIGVNVWRSYMGVFGETEVLVGPSADVITPDVAMCRGESETISATLRGTAPFRVAWSDGVEQEGITADVASRSVSPDQATAYAIIHVSDAMCAGVAEGSVLVDVMAAPHVVQQPTNKHVKTGQTATLTVSAEGDGMTFRWYEGESGDRSHLAATGLPTYTTPPLSKTTSYWVSVENECGIEESTTAIVIVGGMGRRRSARH